MLLLVTFLLTLISTSYAQSCTKYSVVQEGETCLSIMSKFMIDQATFTASNPTINCATIQTGQIVCIQSALTTTLATTTTTTTTTTVPISSTTSNTPTSACSSFYFVKSGDTCASIIMENGQDPLGFLSLNPSLNCNNLVTGQVVCLGNPTQATTTTTTTTTTTPSTTTYTTTISTSNVYTCQSFYFVKSGDTCTSIIVSCKQDPRAFNSLNPSLNCENLVPGQVICLTNASQVTTITTTPPTTTTPPRPCRRTYNTYSGDSCALIIHYNGLTIEQFLAMNPTVNCQDLLPNTTICLEQYDTTLSSLTTTTITTTTLLKTSTTTPVPKPPCSKMFTVQSGDTCWSIYSYYGLSQQELSNLNPSLDCNNLQPGQLVCICSKYHVVKAGEYCYLIYNNYKISPDLFYSLNPNINCSNLEPGDLVIVKPYC
jgi:LysM repeat protein